ncbi:hypothetical protein FANTH_1769 [Fusarium anthophilum]|uniref:Uncharacterized protein n=1 Tax=Fusarium anthophilum TaxID=48485 RepID=A0A8H4ZWL8_9HYPO|nr:hypothetical protein FANTH_1769 [Fusarium anthophilum]
MDATGDVILVQGGGSVAATRQTSRTMKRTANLQERLQEKSQAVGERADAVVAPLHGGAGGESELADKAGKSQMLEDASGNNVSLTRTMLRAMLHETSTQLMDEQKKMLERLWDALMGNQRMTTQMMGEQLEMVRQLQQEVQAVKTQAVEESRKMRLQVMKEVGIAQGQAAEEIRQAKEELNQAKEEISQMKEQLNMIAGSISSGAQTSPQPSYADVARTPPTSQPSNVRTLSSMRTTPSSFTDTLFCTIDTSRVSEEGRGKAHVGEARQAIEEKVRARVVGQPNWRCAAVVKDVRNEDRIKVVCRDEAELQLVREAAERTMVKGVRVLRDQLYPVKVDGANRTAVLDSSGNILPSAAEALGKENEVTIASPESRPALMSMSDAKAPTNATTAGRLAIKPLPAVKHNDAASVRRRDIAIETAKRSNQSVFDAEDHTSRSVKTVSSTCIRRM